MSNFKNYLTSRLSIIYISQISSFLVPKINHSYKTTIGDNLVRGPIERIPSFIGSKKFKFRQKLVINFFISIFHSENSNENLLLLKD